MRTELKSPMTAEFTRVSWRTGMFIGPEDNKSVEADRELDFTHFVYSGR